LFPLRQEMDAIKLKEKEKMINNSNHSNLEEISTP